MASVSEVRSVVDSIVGTYLGNYNLPDGSSSPALWVRGSQQFRRTGLSQAQNVS